MSDQFQLQPWHLYRGTGPSAGRQASSIPDAPPWRRFSSQRGATGETFKPPPTAIQAVNAALYLRRPLLVTGKPGTGKSSLAESIAWDLNLGEVLRWPVSSRSTVADGIYRYDAIGRLHQTQLERNQTSTLALDPIQQPADSSGEQSDMSEFLSLGPLGTALAETTKPRVLLVDELDKSDIDFPNDLLNILEDGEYEISELARMEQSSITVKTWKNRGTVTMVHGMLTAKHFPVVVFTSNGEREFPPPFLRRCVRLELQLPSRDELLQMVQNHLGNAVMEQAGTIVDTFLSKRTAGDLPNDYLLNAVYLATRQIRPDGTTWDELLDKVLLRPISGIGA
jgi:MoxR-like ATPase